MINLGFTSKISFTGNDTQPKVLYSTKYLELRSASAPDGKFNWAYAHRPNVNNVAVIAPIIHNEDGDSIVFVETKRPPLVAEGKAPSCIELPAGLVGDENKNETVEEGINKELLEETGYKADKITIKTTKLASSPGCVSETSTVAIADINNDEIIEPPVSDGGVITAIHKIPLNNADNWLREQQEEGKAVSAQALSGMYFVLSRIMQSGEGNVKTQ